jgi:hypothetical protein
MGYRYEIYTQRQHIQKELDEMEKVTFIVDDKTGDLAWMAPPLAPDLTDGQARTLAIMHLSRSLERLASSIDASTNRKINEIGTP